MPNGLEQELRAVQSSIAFVKKKLKEDDISRSRLTILNTALKMYRKEEKRLLDEINR